MKLRVRDYSGRESVCLVCANVNVRQEQRKGQMKPLQCSLHCHCTG